MGTKDVVVARAHCPKCNEEVKIHHEDAKELLQEGSISCAKCGAENLKVDSSAASLERHVKKLEDAGKKYAGVLTFSAPIILLAVTLHLFGKISTGMFAVIAIPAVLFQFMAAPGKEVKSPHEVDLVCIDSPT